MSTYVNTAIMEYYNFLILTIKNRVKIAHLVVDESNSLYIKS